MTATAEPRAEVGAASRRGALDLGARRRAARGRRRRWVRARRRTRPARGRADGPARAAPVRAPRLRRRPTRPRRARRLPFGAARPSAGRGARRPAGREARRARPPGGDRGERAGATQPAARPSLQGARHESPDHRAADRAVHPPVPALGRLADAGALRRGALVRARREGCRVGDASTPSATPSSSCWSSCSPSALRASTSSATPQPAATAAAARAAWASGLYMVWPAFYTDVTDAYRLAAARPAAHRPRRPLLQRHLRRSPRSAVWLRPARDAVLLLVAAPADADGAAALARRAGSTATTSSPTSRASPISTPHIGPTLRRLLPWNRDEPSALTGRARLIVTLWVLVIVPVLLSLALAAILLLPRLLATAWASARTIAPAIPDQAGEGDVVGAVTGGIQLLGLALPALGQPSC